jgi:hypothetical protein
MSFEYLTARGDNFWESSSAALERGCTSGSGSFWTVRCELLSLIPGLVRDVRELLSLMLGLVLP